MTTDLADVIADVDNAIIQLRSIRIQLATVHALAWERQVTGQAGRSTRLYHYGDDTGRQDAKIEYQRLTAWLGLTKPDRVRDGYHPLLAVAVGFDRIMKDGRADESLLGSTISDAELEEARAMQAKREHRAP